MPKVAACHPLSFSDFPSDDVSLLAAPPQSLDAIGNAPRWFAASFCSAAATCSASQVQQKFAASPDFGKAASGLPGPDEPILWCAPGPECAL